MRLPRRRDAMQEWRRAAKRGAPPPVSEPRAPDLDPSEVPPPKKVGFSGRPLKEARGGVTGLDGGGSGTPPTVINS